MVANKGRRRQLSAVVPATGAEERLHRSRPDPRSTLLHSSFIRQNWILSSCIIAFLLVVGASLFYRFLKTLSEEPGKSGGSCASASVYDRGLVTQRPSYRDIIDASSRGWCNLTHRHLPTSVLGYVTPWNRNGYEMAKKYRAKFTHISPVWYQLRRNHKGLELIGGHNIDPDWIKDVQFKGQPLIVPRIVMEGWPLDSMLVEKGERLQVIQLLTSECRKREYDGIVFEAWSLWSAYGILSSKLRQKALDFVQELGSALHKTILPYKNQAMQLIFVIPPTASTETEGAQYFTAADMLYLKDAVDAYSLMTYDFSNLHNPGPNAPLSWMRSCINAITIPSGHFREKKLAGNGKSHDISKILVGINFYGNDFVLPQGGGPLLGHEYLQRLSLYKPAFFWDAINDEHYFDYTTGKELHKVFYPSLKSVSLRLEQAKVYGAGVSIWELGQGLEYFFDLL